MKDAAWKRDAGCEIGGDEERPHPYSRAMYDDC